MRRTPDPNPELRYERKFVVRGAAVLDPVERVKLHPAFFHEAYPPRHVNNVYLDAPDFAHYSDHVAGSPRRVKVRVRWYGDLTGDAGARLELKSKAGAVGGKRSFPIGGLRFDGGFGPGLVETVVAALPPGVALDVERLAPVLLNRYHRRYFVSADRAFRITVDRDLLFWAVGPGGRVTKGPGRRLDRQVIELKYDARHARDASEVASALGLRLVKNSKYVAGVQLLYTALAPIE